MHATPDAKSKQGLTALKAKEIFERIFNGKEPDFDLVEQYYNSDVIFQDSIQTLNGRDAFIEMSKRFVKRCSELQVDVHNALQGESEIFLHWTMKFKFLLFPPSIFEGVTKLTLNEEGRVILHRDFFDVWGEVLRPIPVVGGLYSGFMKLMG